MGIFSLTVKRYPLFRFPSTPQIFRIRLVAINSNSHTLGMGMDIYARTWEIGCCLFFFFVLSSSFVNLLWRRLALSEVSFRFSLFHFIQRFLDLDALTDFFSPNFFFAYQLFVLLIFISLHSLLITRYWRCCCYSLLKFRWQSHLNRNHSDGGLFFFSFQSSGSISSFDLSRSHWQCVK